MPRDYVPSGDEPFGTFAVNFGRRIAATPEAFDIAPAVAAAYVASAQGYQDRLLASRDPETRGARTVFLKSEAKAALMAETRRLAQQIKNLTTVNDDQRQALGLAIAGGAGPSRVPAPRVAPILEVVAVRGRTVTVRLRTGEAGRGKPAGAASATVFTHVGPAAPQAIGGWQFAATVTRTSVELPFGPSETGDAAWVTAFWLNAKGQSGPAAEPVRVNLPAGGVVPVETGAATTGSSRMKIAA